MTSGEGTQDSEKRHTGWQGKVLRADRVPGFRARRKCRLVLDREVAVKEPSGLCRDTLGAPGKGPGGHPGNGEGAWPSTGIWAQLWSITNRM